VRELSGIEMRDLLSEPAEFIGKFREENDYNSVIKHIEKENDDNTRN
jgi:hypothetical protein